MKTLKIALAGVLAAGIVGLAPMQADAASRPTPQPSGNFVPGAKLDRTQVGKGGKLPRGTCYLKYNGQYLAMARAVLIRNPSGMSTIRITADTGRRSIRVGRANVPMVVTPIRGQHTYNGYAINKGMVEVHKNVFVVTTILGYYDWITYKTPSVMDVWTTQHWKVSTPSGKTMGYGACNLAPTGAR